MLLRSMVERFGSFIRLGNLTGHFPYSWDEKQKRLYHTKKVWLLRLWKFRIGLVFLYLVYLTTSVLLYKKEQRRVTNLSIHSMWIFTYLLTSLLHANTILRRNEELNFINQFLNFNKHQLGYPLTSGRTCKNEVSRRREKTGKALSKLMTFFGAIAISHTIMCVLLFYVMYRKPYFVSSVFLRRRKGMNHPVFLTFFAVLELTFFVHNWVTVLYHIFFVISYSMSMKLWLLELRKKFEAYEVGDEGIGKRSGLLLQFKHLIVLNSRFREFVYPLVWQGHKVIVIPLAIASNYGSLRLYNKLSPTAFSLYPLLWFITTIFQFIFYRLSMDLFRDSKVIYKFYLKRTFCCGSSKANSRYQFLRASQNPGCPDFPKHVSSFSMLNQWSPPRFIKNMLFYSVKIHFYLHSNVEIFKRS